MYYLAKKYIGGEGLEGRRVKNKVRK